MRLRQRIEKLEARVIDSDNNVARDAAEFMVKMMALSERVREGGEFKGDTQFPLSENINEVCENSSRTATWSMLLRAIGRELP